MFILLITVDLNAIKTASTTYKKYVKGLLSTAYMHMYSALQTFAIICEICKIVLHVSSKLVTWYVKESRFG